MVRNLLLTWILYFLTSGGQAGDFLASRSQGTQQLLLQTVSPSRHEKS